MRSTLLYSLDQTPRLLFVLSINFVWIQFKSGNYWRVAFFLFNPVKLKKNSCTKGLDFYSINSELTCGDFVSKKDLQHLDQPSLFDKAVPTWHLQSSFPFSSNKEDEGELEEDEGELEEDEGKLEENKLFQKTTSLSLNSLLVFLLVFACFCIQVTRFVHVCTCHSNI